MDSMLDQAILEKLHQLNDHQKQKVLDFVEQQLEPSKTLSAQALLRLPLAERQQHVEAAFKAAQDEDFEIFEAYREESLDE